MEYKPDKFEKAAIKIIAIVMFTALGGMLVVMTVVRFSNPDEELFSTGNVIKGVVVSIAFIIGGYFWANKKDKQE